MLPDIEVDFKDKLKELVPALLAGDKLIVKEINGCQVTCRDLVEYFKVVYDCTKVNLIAAFCAEK